MACNITMLGAFLSRGQLDRAVAAVAAYQTVVSTEVRTGGQKVKLVGTVLHISKAKKVGYTRTFAEKKAKRETTYFRLVFCREHGDNTGDVFAVLFNADDRQRFQISNIVIGQGIIIIKPQLEGEWRGIQIVHTPEPCLPGDTNWTPFLPSPFPDRGFMSFAVTDVHMTVVSVAVTRTCSGKTCGGLYGSAACPCVTTSHLPCHALAISASFGHRTADGNFVDQFEELGLRLEPYSSTEFSQQLVDPQLLEAAVRTQDERLIDILSYVEDELQLDTWSVLLWSKAVTTTMDDNAPLLSPKCHVVALKRLSDRPLRYTPHADDSGDPDPTASCAEPLTAQ